MAMEQLEIPINKTSLRASVRQLPSFLLLSGYSPVNRGRNNQVLIKGLMEGKICDLTLKWK